MALVGSAYVTLRLISNQIKDDIHGSVSKALDDPKLQKNVDDKLKKMFSSLGKNPKMLWAAILGIPALGPAIQIIGAYLAQAISFVSALGPAMAASAAVGVVGMLAFKQASGVFSMAMKTKTPELERYRAVVQSLKATMAGKIQDNILPALGGAYARIIPIISGQLVNTSRVIGNVITQTSKFAASPLIRGEIQTVMAKNNVVLSIMAQVLQPLINIILRLVLAAQPVAIVFSHWVVSMVEAINKSVMLGSETGKLAAFFQRGARTAALLGDIGKKAFGGLFEIMKAARPAGDNLLLILDDLVTRFYYWTKSTTGQNSLVKYFNDARPIMHEFNGLIGDIFGAFKHGLLFPSTGNLVGGLQSIRAILGPLLQTILTAFSSSGPGLAKVFADFGQIIQHLAESGALGTFSATLNIILTIFDKLLQMPIIGQLAGWGIAFLGVAKAISLVPGSMALIGGGVRGVVADLFRLREGVEGTSKIGAVFSKIGMALRASFAFLMANPIILVVAAIVIGLILMYTKVKWFRDFVNAAWADIKKWSIQLWENGIKPAAEGIKTGFEAAMRGIEWAWKNILKPTWDVIQVAIGLLWNYYIHPIIKLWMLEWRILWDITKFVWDAIGVAIAITVALIAMYWKYYLEPIFKAYGFLAMWLWNNALSPAFNGIRRGFSDMCQFIQLGWTSVISPIFHAIAALAMWLWTNGVSPAVSAIKTGFSIMGSEIKWVWNNVVNPIFSFMERGASRIGNGIMTTFRAVKSTISAIWSGVAGPLATALNTIIDIANVGIRAIDSVHIDIPNIPGLPHRGERLGLSIPQIPHINMARGGTASPGPGGRGVMAYIAEAGRKERVEPLDSTGLSQRDRAIIQLLAGNRYDGPPIQSIVYAAPGHSEEEIGRIASMQIAETLGIGTAGH